MTEGISSELEQFIARHIDSVHTLEVLFLLRRFPARQWSADEVNEAVKSSPGAAKESLEGLVASKLVAQVDLQQGLFKYHPVHEGDDRLTEILERIYSERHSAVIECIYAKPLRDAQNLPDVSKRRPPDK